MKIKVLGPGCPKCKKLEENVRTAVSELGLDCEVEKITDIKMITAYGVMRTPALVTDDKVKVQGKVATVEEIKKLLS